MSEPVILMELHSEQCACGGGAFLVNAGQMGSPRCSRPDGGPPFGAVYMSMDEWTGLGKPINTEAQRVALQQVTDRREAPRIKVSVNLRLFAVTAPTVPLGLAVTENLGEGGALLLSSVSLAKGENVLAEELQGAFKSRAHVEEATRLPAVPGQPPVFRIRLRFLDVEASRQVRKLLYNKARERGGGDRS